MFIGHWAPGLIAAGARKSNNVTCLAVAGQFLDWLFFSFVLLGAEHLRMRPGISAMSPMDLYDMPYTHSLVGALGWSVLFGGGVWLVVRNRTAALVAGAVVLSHWLLDLLVHVPDLTIAGSAPKLGLGLWNHPWLEMPLELALTFGALGYYARASGAAMGRVLVLGALLLGLQLFNWFGPVATEVTTGSSLLALFAYGLVTVTARWMGKTDRRAG